MSRLISRILLAIFVFPLAGMFNFVVFYFADTNSWGPETSVRVGSSATAAFIVTYWILLWRKSVSWTTRRVLRTFLCGIAALIAGAALGFAMSRDRPWGQDVVATYCGLTVVPLLWVAGTVFIWRETAQERSARLMRSSADSIVCPTCGYNLTGLSEARCPECGAKFTLNELLASQPSRAAAEIEG